ncbi:hypothetical protein ES703_68350 [subsurface metagenome]
MDKVDRKYFWRDKVWLREKYSIEGLSCAQVGVLAGCDPKTIYNWLLKFKIHIRTKGEAIDLKCGKSKEAVPSLDILTESDEEREDREILELSVKESKGELSPRERIEYLNRRDKREGELKESRAKIREVEEAKIKARHDKQEDQELLQLRLRNELGMLTYEELEDYWERKKAREKQLRDEETQKRHGLQIEEQAKLKAALKKESSRLLGTAKEQMDAWQLLSDDLSGYKK